MPISKTPQMKTVPVKKLKIPKSGMRTTGLINNPVKIARPDERKHAESGPFMKKRNKSDRPR